MSKRVLVVEDDMVLLFFIKKMVDGLGHNVVATARSAEDAIANAKQSDPDIILMDIRLLGQMDGIEATSEIHKFSKARVIYISGNSDPRYFERAKQTNMHAFLVKPVSTEMIREAIDRLN
jgi:two-component system, response regulator PdtaR